MFNNIQESKDRFYIFFRFNFERDSNQSFTKIKIFHIFLYFLWFFVSLNFIFKSYLIGCQFIIKKDILKALMIKLQRNVKTTRQSMSDDFPNENSWLKNDTKTQQKKTRLRNFILKTQIYDFFSYFHENKFSNISIYSINCEILNNNIIVIVSYHLIK